MKSVTALYAGLTMLLFAGLSLKVSLLRMKHKTKIGDNSNPDVLRASRAQGNCAEYVAALFLMLLLAEMLDGNKTVLHVIGGTIFLARVVHAYGVLGDLVPARQIGATLNYLALFGLPIWVLVLRFN